MIVMLIVGLYSAVFLVLFCAGIILGTLVSPEFHAVSPTNPATVAELCRTRRDLTRLIEHDRHFAVQHSHSLWMHRCYGVCASRRTA